MSEEKRSTAEKKVIQLVGEESEELRQMGEALKAAGYRLAATVELADTFTIAGKQADLLIIDLPLTTEGSVKACEQAIEAARSLFLPTILVSSREEREHRAEGGRLEADEVLLKPFSHEDLLARVRFLIRIKELQDQLRELAYNLRQDQRRVLLDLDLARKAEMRLLPRTFPELSEFKFQARYEPSEKVGGDLYDVVELGKHQIAVLIADAAGKGLCAALLIALTKMSFRSFCEITSSPRVIIERTNQLLGEVARPEDFVSAFLAIVDRTNLSMRYINASHPPPILIRNAKLEELETEGFLLGIGGDANYEERELRLQPGDKLLLYTNGVVDVVNLAGQYYQKQRLQQQVTELADKTIAELVAGIYQDLSDFAQGAARRDDLTLLGFEVVAPPAQHYRMVLRSTPAKVEPAIQRVTQTARQSHFSDELLFNVRLGIIEALRNAIEHGNKFDPNKKVILEMDIDPQKVAISVTDEGDGFDYSHLPDPTRAESIMQERGRGIFLIKICMDEVGFNEKGNQIRMVKYR